MILVIWDGWREVDIQEVETSSSIMVQWLTNPTRNHVVVRLIPGLAQ